MKTDEARNGFDWATLFLISAVALPLTMWSAVVVVFLLMVPKFREIFLDFGVQLPPVSSAIVATSGWLRGTGQVIPWVIPAAMGIVLVIALAGAAASRRPTRVAGIALLILLFLLPLGILGTVVVGMYLPMVEMIESLQASNP